MEAAVSGVDDLALGQWEKRNKFHMVSFHAAPPTEFPRVSQRTTITCQRRILLFDKTQRGP